MSVETEGGLGCFYGRDHASSGASLPGLSGPAPPEQQRSPGARLLGPSTGAGGGGPKGPRNGNYVRWAAKGVWVNF